MSEAAERAKGIIDQFEDTHNAKSLEIHARYITAMALGEIADAIIKLSQSK